MTLEKIKKNFEILKTIAQSNPKLRNKLINSCNGEVVCCICECILNVLKGNVELESNTYVKLRRHKNILRKLLSKSESLKNKKILLTQKGHGVILPLILPSLLDIVSQILK